MPSQTATLETEKNHEPIVESVAQPVTETSKENTTETEPKKEDLNKATSFKDEDNQRQRRSLQQARSMANKIKKKSSSNLRNQRATFNTSLFANTQSMERFLDDDLTNIIFSLQSHIPLYQYAQNNDKLHDLVVGFHKEIQDNANDYMARIEKEIEMIVNSSSIYQERMKCTKLEEPLEYEVTFTHQYSWGYIDLLTRLDAILLQTHKLNLTALVDPNELKKITDELLPVIQTTFRSLSYISKLRIRRGGEGKEDIVKFKTIVENYRKLMVRYE